MAETADHRENKKNGSVNIYDISSEAGVSIATVSRVLNGSDKVSEKTREKVLATMKALGYQPNAFARGLGLGSMKTIGIMCMDASDMHLASSVYHAELALREQGYSAILTCTGNKLSTKKSSMKFLLSKKVDGIILTGSSFIEIQESDCEYIRKAARQVPIVITNGYMEGDHIYCVMNNDFESTFKIVDALLGRGRTNIMYLYGAQTYSGLQKLNGYRAAYGARGIQPQQELVVVAPKKVDETIARIREISEAGIHFDAVVTADDVYAVAAMKWAREHMVDVPGDLEIVGYNNSLLSQCTIPELSSIDNHVEQNSRKAVELLVNALQGEETEKSVVVPCDFVRRGSSEI